MPIVRGSREAPASKLWRMTVVPEGDGTIEDHGGETVPLSAFSDYDNLPSVHIRERGTNVNT